MISDFQIYVIAFYSLWSSIDDLNNCWSNHLVFFFFGRLCGFYHLEKFPLIARFGMWCPHIRWETLCRNCNICNDIQSENFYLDKASVSVLDKRGWYNFCTKFFVVLIKRFWKWPQIPIYIFDWLYFFMHQHGLMLVWKRATFICFKVVLCFLVAHVSKMIWNLGHNLVPSFCTI